MQHETGVPGESTAYRDSKVPKRTVPILRQVLRVHLLPGEELLGLFSAYRFRRSITMLVVTDRRLLTLGEMDKGMPIVDEVFRSTVTSVHVEREKVLTAGRVVAETEDGQVNLGTLEFANDGSTFLGLDEVLARRTTASGMPVIPVPGHVRSPEPSDGPVGAPAPGDEQAVPGAAGAPAATHPLIAHLSALADLHERGALTDEEFAAAKARLLESRDG